MNNSAGTPFLAISAEKTQFLKPVPSMQLGYQPPLRVWQIVGQRAPSCCRKARGPRMQSPAAHCVCRARFTASLLPLRRLNCPPIPPEICPLALSRPGREGRVPGADTLSPGWLNSLNCGVLGSRHLLKGQPVPPPNSSLSESWVSCKPFTVRLFDSGREIL